MNNSSLGRFSYSLRPGKTIERKMLCEVFARFARISPLSTYRYIGFGSIEFCDFRLFHERLGITQMISIEGRQDAKKRVEFNCPLACIDVKWGLSHGVLPTLEWSKRTIIWLDYDTPLDKEKLKDIALIAGAARTGSVLIVTVPVEPGDSADSKVHQKRFSELADKVGRVKIPTTIGPKSLANWGLGKACREIVNNEILETLNSRNGPLSVDQKISYQQLFNFHYADGIKMLSVGGIFLNEDDKKGFPIEEYFGDLEFIRFDENPFRIKTPILTWQEMRLLDKSLPAAEKLPFDWLPEEHLESYRKVYRYYPNFTEVEA